MAWGMVFIQYVPCTCSYTCTCTCIILYTYMYTYMYTWCVSNSPFLGEVCFWPTWVYIPKWLLYLHWAGHSFICNKSFIQSTTYVPKYLFMYFHTQVRWNLECAYLYMCDDKNCTKVHMYVMAIIYYSVEK